ncbi:MAG TPA: tyrosine-protein phosphatase [Pyrinomonadaceae bacterium]|nr:tyrosine-protein phosphatase [Pyrinomonadaceae bacterium]
MALSWNDKGRNALLALITVLSVGVVCSAQTVSDSSSNQSIKIKNFGQMDDRFYRGAQPKEQDYKALAQLGIKTVIDLREDPEDYSKSMAEAVGMTYVNIPMIAKKYPTPEATATFLKTVNDPATGKFFVHCAGGRHRTGAMGAVYRFQFYNWNFDQVYKEMKQYDFYTSWGHGAFKDFVKDYARAREAQTQQSKPTEK